MSKYKNIEDVISFFVSSETTDLALNLSQSVVIGQAITTVSSAIGTIALAIADAKVDSKPQSPDPLYIDAFNMAREIIVYRRANTPKTMEGLRKLMGNDVQVKTRKWDDRDD